MKKLWCLFYLLFFCSAFGQTPPPSPNKSTPDPTENPTSDSSKTIEDPKKSEKKKDGRSFRGISLLSNYDTVLNAIKKDSLIIITPEYDFGDFLDEPNPDWIVAQLPPLARKIYYQFYNKKLYVISLFLNPERTSYSELYQKMKKNYGMPSKALPEQVSWQINKNTLVILDALPSIKYIDTDVFKILNKVDNRKDPMSQLIKQQHQLEEKVLDGL